MLQAMGVPVPNAPPVTTEQILRNAQAETAGHCLEVLEKSPTGRNEIFKNKDTGVVQFANLVASNIGQGRLPDYHNRITGDKMTPASNPDDSKTNNLNK